MSTVYDLVLNHSRAKGCARLVVVTLALNWNKNCDCWVTVDWLVEKTRCSRTSVRQALNRLVKLRELRIEKHSGQPNKYQLLLNEPDELRAHGPRVEP